MSASPFLLSSDGGGTDPKHTPADSGDAGRTTPDTMNDNTMSGRSRKHTPGTPNPYPHLPPVVG